MLKIECLLRNTSFVSIVESDAVCLANLAGVLKIDIRIIKDFVDKGGIFLSLGIAFRDAISTSRT